MSNSMLAYLTPSSIANDALLKRSAKRQRNLGEVSIIIVEGTWDQRVYTILANHPNNVIVRSNGKKNAIEAISVLSQRNERGVMAIVDDDYDTLCNRNICRKNIVVTDTHDIETLIISSPALRKFIALILPNDKLDLIDQFYEATLKKMIFFTKPIGFIRWFTYENNCGWDFKNMYPENFMDLQNKTIDLGKYLVDLMATNMGSPCMPKDLIKQVNEKMLENHNPWLVCHGHDVVKILIPILQTELSVYLGAYSIQEREYLEKTISQKVSRSRLLMEWLVACYEREYFRKTKLYTQIRSWEAENSPYKIVSDD